jgi:hypothetical protein
MADDPAMMSPVTTRLITMLMTFLATLSLLPTSTAAADDAAIKKQLVGSWKGPDNQPIVLKANGVFDNHCGECTQTQRWDVHNGVFRTWFGNTGYGGPDSTGNNEFKILSLSKTKFVIQDMYHGRHTGSWTR